MWYTLYGDSMKMKVYEKALELFQKKIKLLKKENEIIASYCVDIEEAFVKTTYYYVRTKDGRDALYLYPEFELIQGENFISKNQLINLPKKTYKNKHELVRDSVTESYFFRALEKYKSAKNWKYRNSRHHNGISYLTSLYYGEDKKKLRDYINLYETLKRECDLLGIEYETDTEKIVKQKLERCREIDDFKYLDFRFCYSKEKIDEYYNEILKKATDSRSLSYEVSNLKYLKSAFIMNYAGDFLSNSDTLIAALEDYDHPNRNENKHN